MKCRPLINLINQNPRNQLPQGMRAQSLSEGICWPYLQNLGTLGQIVELVDPTFAPRKLLAAKLTTTFCYSLGTWPRSPMKGTTALSRHGRCRAKSPVS